MLANATIPSLVVALLVLSCRAAAATSPPSSRNLDGLARWAVQNGVVMHDCLAWTHEEHDGDNGADGGGDNIGLELRDAVDAGTVLLRVPRSIVFDARRIRDELQRRSPDEVAKALQCLEREGFAQPAEAFFLFVAVWKCAIEGEPSFWGPYIQSLPRSFVTFSDAEKGCLPFYAAYIAEHQDKKFEAFYEAASASGLVVDANADEEEGVSKDLARWAFSAVHSRFWNSRSTEEATAALMGTAEDADREDTGTSELVPVGDMFNHNEPPNIRITHEGGYVNFVYKGKNDGDGKDLHISYGQPANPHRFLGIFGFVPSPDSIPNVWSHLSYPGNPFAADVERMVFRTSDGHISENVWDAVLYALMEPEHAPDQLPQFTKEQHRRFREFTSDVLSTHIEKQLQELAALKVKIQALEDGVGNEGDEASNVGIIRQNNDFLSGVFEKALQQVGAEVAEGQ